MDRELPSADDSAPIVADRYQIRGEIGRGAMGVVFRAWDAVLQREVALKRLSSDAAGNRSGWDDLLREARAASVLRHPAIVSVHDAFQDQGACYLVEELVSGVPLRDLLGSPWELDRFRPFARECAEALAEAAAAGIVHCDLKPENILVTVEGRPRILDFGVARCPSRTMCGSDDRTMEISPEATTQSLPRLEGTASYLAPERIRGAAADTRSDLFALGVVFYEMVTGIHPYRRASVGETLAAILHETPVPASSLRPAIPEEIDALLQRLLARDPEDRPASPGCLVGLLDHPAVDDRMRPNSRAGPAQSKAVSDGRIRRGVGRIAARWPGRALVVAMIGVAGFFAVSRLARDDRTRPPGVPLLVVEPFRVLSASPGDTVFALGLTEALTTRLAGLQGIQIVTAAADPGALLALEGTVQRSRDHLRIAYRIVERKRGVVLAGSMSEGSSDDLFSLQDQVTDGVSSVLARRYGVTGASLQAPRPTDSAAAYEIYLRARGFLQRPGEAEDRRTAAGLFLRCLEIDPGFALAQAGLAEAFWKTFEETRDPTWAGQAEEAAQKALVMAPGLAEVRVALGTIYNGTGRPEKAAAEFRQALAIDPRQDAAVLGLANSEELRGDFDAAEQAYLEAIASQPDDWYVRSHLGAFYFRQVRLEDALLSFQEVIRLTPGNARAHLNLGAALQMLGREEEAIAAYETSISIKPNYRAHSNLATLYRSQGRFAEAADSYRRALELEDNDYRVWGSLAGTLTLIRGRGPEAENAYRQAVRRAERELEVRPGNPFVEAMLAQYYVELREPEKGRAMVERARAEGGNRPDVCVQVAAAYELLGDRQEALEMVCAGLDLGCEPESWTRDPAMASLAADPEFIRMVQTRHEKGDPE